MAQFHAKQLVVIKAGVGFGKTSLAVAWEEQLQRSGHGVAWLALDGDDDEPISLLSVAPAAAGMPWDRRSGDQSDFGYFLGAA
jgi:ATP/maltotriose-dependent transcriptional regulator MalT